MSRSRVAESKEVYEGGGSLQVGPVFRPTDSSKKPESENVVAQDVSVGSAKEKFAGAKMDSLRTGADPSGLIGGGYRMLGSSHPHSFEHLGPSQPETRYQRYLRLIDEAQELLVEDEQARQKQSSGDNKDADVLPSYAVSHLRQLHQRLHDVVGVVGSVPSSSQHVKQGVDQVVAAVEAVRGVVTENNSTAGGGVRYEIYSRGGDDANLMEQRIQRVERVVGTTSTSTLEQEEGLWRRVDTVMDQLKLLEDGKLQQLQQRMKDLTEQFQQLEKAKRLAAAATGGDAAVSSSLSSSSSDASVVKELLESIQRWDSVASSLPVLVARLKSLRGLHEQAANFANTLHTVETEQAAMKTSLTEGIAQLSAIQKGLEANEAIVKQNVAQLNARLDALVKK